MPYITVDVFIEISKNSHIKYEYEKTQKLLICNRVMNTPFKYQFNYGFIPNTISLDNDPLDVIVVMDDEILPGSLIKCKFIGVLETKDEYGIDPKIIMCPCNKVDSTSSNINKLDDLPESTLKKIKYFFAHYKDLEDKKVIVKEFRSREYAIELYTESLKRYNILQKNNKTLSITNKTNPKINYFPIFFNSKIYY